MEPVSRERRSTVIEYNENQILDRISAGHAEAFNELVIRYRSRIYSYAYYLTHSRDDAEDITQETFVRAFMNLNQFRREASFFTWLYRIASNVGYQLIGKLARQRKIKENLSNKLEPEHQHHAVTPEAVMLQDEVQRIVLEAMWKLRPKHREALILKEINGLDVLDVAKICNVPEGTIKSRLNRARLELKKQINRISTIGGELES